MLARQQNRLYSIPQDIIQEFGGQHSTRVICRGKVMSVEHNLTTTAHTTGKVVLQQLSSSDDDVDAAGVEVDGSVLPRIVVEFVNENLRVKSVSIDGSENCLAIVPDLIFLLDMSTGEAVGTPEYR